MVSFVHYGARQGLLSNSISTSPQSLIQTWTCNGCPINRKSKNHETVFAVTMRLPIRCISSTPFRESRKRKRNLCFEPSCPPSIITYSIVEHYYGFGHTVTVALIVSWIVLLPLIVLLVYAALRLRLPDLST
jgi:hypothetical protein